MNSPNMVEERKLEEEKEYLIIYREVLLEEQMILDFKEAEVLHTLVFNKKYINSNLKKKIFKK